MFITFIYRIENNPKTYFGKFCTYYISDDHEGLDKEVLMDLLIGVNKYRQRHNLDEITENQVRIGILSFSFNKYIPVDSSNDEAKCFDFYCNAYHSKNSTIYINGNIV
jgi:hypothetical protein